MLSEFNDETGDFAGDLRHAMDGEGWRGPAFGDFKQAVVEGRLFAVVTARGHGGETMRRSVEGFLDAILSEDEKGKMLQNLRRFCDLALEDVLDGDLVRKYLDLCQFIGVSHPDFVARSGMTRAEEGKKYAIRGFVKDVMEISGKAFEQSGQKIASISFGMSDDDRKNVETVDALMRDELSLDYTRVKFVVFDTGIGGGKVRRLKSHISDPDKVPPPLVASTA